MGILTREEKLYVDPKTGKKMWVTTKKGIIRPRKTKTSLDVAVKEYQQKEKALRRQASKTKWAKRKKTAKRVSKDINRALDWIEGKPPKKQKQHVKPPKTHYVIRNGKAYPVHQQKQNKPTKQPSKKKKSNNLLDMKINW